jgi:SAM-dependent methyltransferase
MNHLSRGPMRGIARYKSKKIMDKEIKMIFPEEVVSVQQKFIEPIIEEMKSAGIIQNIEDLHGEFDKLVNAPFAKGTYEHLMHLRYFESLYPSKRLSFLDLGCGSGDFSYMSLRRGHECLSIDTNSYLDESQKDLFYFLNKTRLFSRSIYNLNFINHVVRPETELPFEKQKFDIIYLNQCTLFQSVYAEPDRYWGANEWHIFFKKLVDHLNPQGTIFITLASPTYLVLGKYLRFFYEPYGRNFDQINWWTLLIVNHQKFSEAAMILDKLMNDNIEHYKSVGITNSRKVISRLKNYDARELIKSV